MAVLESNGVPEDLEKRADEMERRIDQAEEEGLAIWQSNNCVRCVFADPDEVGTGNPCCTRVNGPEPLGAICLARREI